MQPKINNVTSARHQKKHDALIVNKGITDGIRKNPNNAITNLTRFLQRKKCKFLILV